MQLTTTAHTVTTPVPAIGGVHELSRLVLSTLLVWVIALAQFMVCESVEPEAGPRLPVFVEAKEVGLLPGNTPITNPLKTVCKPSTVVRAQFTHPRLAAGKHIVQANPRMRSHAAVQVLTPPVLYSSKV